MNPETVAKIMDAVGRVEAGVREIKDRQEKAETARRQAQIRTDHRIDLAFRLTDHRIDLAFRLIRKFCPEPDRYWEIVKEVEAQLKAEEPK